MLYDPSWQLAAGVHWYVISVLTRQHSTFAPKEKDGGTADGDEDAEENEKEEKKKKKAATARPKASKPRHVDWFELLEFFLRHPAAGTENLVAKEEKTCLPIVHVVDNRRRIDSLETPRSATGTPPALRRRSRGNRSPMRISTRVP